MKTAGAVALFLLFWNFSPPAEPRFPLCAFHWLTGLDCPLCGLTRALCALAKGHWTEAVHFNALSPLAFAMLFSLFRRGQWTARLWSAGIVAFGLYGVWRVAVRL